MAAAASASLGISTNAKPRARPVSLNLPVLFEAPRAQDLGEGPLPRRYETLA